MTPEEFRLRFIQNRGLNINSTPLPPPPVDAPIVPTQVPVTRGGADLAPPIRTDILPSPGGPATDPTAPPHRLPPAEAVEAWRRGVPLPDVPPAAEPPVAAPPARVPPAFPAGGVAPVIATNPVVDQAPGGGVTLNSTPVAPGWAGTVGIPATPEEAKAFDKGSDYQKLMSGLDEVAKGMKPKAPVAAIPNLVAGAPEPNQSNQLAAQLMAAMLNKNRGLTLTGR